MSPRREPSRPARPITRRRSLALIAAAGGAALLARGDVRAADPTAAAQFHVWRGTALGARATLKIHHPDAGEARRLVAMARAEIERLEAVFSLYRSGSALSRLNRAGRLDDPPLDLVVLLAEAWRWSERTVGAFDATVQPLWRLFADHFAEPKADPRGPSPAAIRAARALVDYRAVDLAAGRVVLARPGMAVTLNGIAQGYITDRVADLLRAEGLAHVLIDLGEIAALGARPDAEPWRIGLPDPLDAGRLVDTLQLVDRAVATSAVSGTVFDRAGRHHHLFDPRSGQPAEGLLAASVVAEKALDADALSTALVADAALLARVDAFGSAGIDRVVAVARSGIVRTMDLS